MTNKSSWKHVLNVNYGLLKAAEEGARECKGQKGPSKDDVQVQGPKLIYVTVLVIFVTAVARLVCPYLLG